MYMESSAASVALLSRSRSAARGPGWLGDAEAYDAVAKLLGLTDQSAWLYAESTIQERSSGECRAGAASAAHARDPVSAKRQRRAPPSTSYSTINRGE